MEVGADDTISKCCRIISFFGDCFLAEETSEDDMYNGIMDFKTVKAPYLAPISRVVQDVTYTLILDLDETLVHYEENDSQGKFLIRPYTYEFIEEMAKYYEVIIFTAAMQDV